MKVHPFRAVRPVRDKVHLVGSRSYLTYDQDELVEKLQGNPYSFLHIIRPELDRTFRDLPLEDRFNRVRQEYEQFYAAGIFQKEEAPALYLYRQTTERHSSLGIIGAVSVQDYKENRIKRHEDTLARREALFAKYLDATQFNAEPVLLVHDEVSGLNEVMDILTHRRPEYEFTTTDKVKHEVWVVDHADEVRDLERLLVDLPAMYIADGHHRTASSALLADQFGGNGDEPWHQLMIYCLPASQIHIDPFHRIVRDLNGMSPQQFLQKLEAQFGKVWKTESGLPEEKGHVHIYLEGNWYGIELKPSTERSWASGLDAYRLRMQVLTPLLDIGDPRTDERISFRGGPGCLDEVVKAVDSGRFKAGFALTAVSYEELKGVSDEGGVMPPKSTYVEPKLRSGITIYELGKRT